MADQMQQARRPDPAGRATGGAVAQNALSESTPLGQAALRMNAGPHAASLAALRSAVAQRECADCEHVRRAMGGADPVQRVVKSGGMPAPVQRKVNLDEFMTDEDRKRLFADDLDMDDLEDIQDLLGDREAVAELLGELEGDTNEQFENPESEYKYTRALDMALFQQERKWMPIKFRKDRARIDAAEKPAPNDEFLSYLESGLPLKDVGAPISHGEYAHRLQWYMISRSLEKNLFKENEGRYDPEAPRAEEYQYLLRTLYKHLGTKEYTKMLQNDNVRGTTEKERNNPVAGQFPLPLWSAILDIPGARTSKPPFDDVYAAAPVKLTGALTFEGTSKETRKGDLQQGPLAYSQLSLAVLNRRIKRFLEKGRAGDVVLANQLTALGKQDGRVRAYLEDGGEDALDYDRRNEIAFKLMGIPWVG